MLIAQTTEQRIILQKCPVSGVPHGDDTHCMFTDAIAGNKLFIEDEHFHITERLLHIVTTFAKHG